MHMHMYARLYTDTMSVNTLPVVLFPLFKAFRSQFQRIMGGKLERRRYARMELKPFTRDIRAAGR
jgi:hypothetical protein